MMRMRLRAGLLAVILSVPVFGVGCSPGDDGSKWHLLTDLATDGQHLILKNGEPFVWKNPTITINNGYTMRLETLPRGNTSLNLSDFKNAEGASFDPEEDKLRSVSVSVPDVMGGKEGVWKW